MSDCCAKPDASDSYPKKHACPSNGKEYGLVSPITIKHHIKSPWLWKEKNQGYYFCSDPDCDVVYFGQDDSILTKQSIRTFIGVKEDSDAAPVCYCFGVTKSEAKNDPRIREFVVEETRQRGCACEYRNPSGKCCLANFPKS